MKNKILFIINLWGNGGIEKVILNYCNLLSKEKYDIDVLALDKRESVFTEELKKTGANFLEHNYVIKGNPIKKQRIRRQIIIEAVKNNNYDIVHYHNSLPIAYSYIKSIKKISPNTKCILHCHGDNAEAPFVLLKKIQNFIYKRIYRNVPDFCAACSEKAGMWLFDKSIYKSKEYMTLVNAFDTRTYSFDNVNRVDFRKKYGIASEFTFGTIGRFCYQKNPELTIEILKELKEKELNYKFIWIGNGPDYNLIKDKAKEYDLLNNIVFIESTKDIPKFLSAIDLFILPSRYEGLCLVLIEAQSSGLDIIAFDNCSREVDITHKIEYLSINDKNKWVDSIEKKIRDYSNYCDHIEAIRKYPEKDIMNSMFDYNLLKINLNTIYENLLKGDE